MCCANCRACVEPVGQEVSDTKSIPVAPATWPVNPDSDVWMETASVKDPDPVATQPLPPTGEEWASEAFDMGTGKPPKVLPRKYLMWLAVDLDGTLAEGIWTPEDPTSEIGQPIGQNVEKARRLAEAGWKIVIHTARPWHDYEAIETWANHFEVPFKQIVCGKLLAAAYIDDRAINADDADWSPRSGDARTEE